MPRSTVASTECFVISSLPSLESCWLEVTDMKRRSGSAGQKPHEPTRRRLPLLFNNLTSCRRLRILLSTTSSVVASKTN